MDHVVGRARRRGRVDRPRRPAQRGRSRSAPSGSRPGGRARAWRRHRRATPSPAAANSVTSWPRSARPSQSRRTTSSMPAVRRAEGPESRVAQAWRYARQWLYPAHSRNMFLRAANTGTLASPMSLEAPRRPGRGGPRPLVNLAETIVTKEENTFVVARRDGSRAGRAAHPLGIYRDDCRFLSGHELCVNGVRPRLLVASSALGSDSVHELTNPALPLPDGRVLPLQSLQLRFERRIVGDDDGRGDAARALLRPRAARARPRPAARRRLRADARDPRHRRDRRGRRRRRHRRLRAASGSPRAAATAVTAPRRSSPTRPCEPGSAPRQPALPRRARARRRRDDPPALRRCTRRPSHRGAARLHSPPRARRRRRLAGCPSARSSRATTSSSTACCGARCSTSGCSTPATATTATTRPACRGTRRCSAATR